ncbi:hypothetical protein Tco_1190391, partial [Tanacetum coccineum]
VSRDPFPKSTEFSADDYVVNVAHLAPFRKFPEPFLCLIGMSRNYTLDADTYPTFLHDDGTGGCLSLYIVQLEEARLLDSTVGRVVPLLPVALARADSELEASVDRLFDEGGSADQGDFAAGGGQEIETEIVMGIRFIADENVVTEKPKRSRKKRQVVTDASGSSHPPKKLRGILLLKPKRPCKKRQAVTDASGSSHPPKKLRGDHRTSSGAGTGGKSPSVLKELLASNMLNVEVGV